MPPCCPMVWTEHISHMYADVESMCKILTTGDSDPMQKDRSLAFILFEIVDEPRMNLVSSLCVLSFSWTIDPVRHCLCLQCVLLLDVSFVLLPSSTIAMLSHTSLETLFPLDDLYIGEPLYCRFELDHFVRSVYLQNA